MIYKNYQGAEIDLKKEILEMISDGSVHQIYIGTDSQIVKKEKIVKYASVVVIHKKGKGGRVFIKRIKDPFVDIKLRQRLNQEAWYSLETAFFLTSFLPKEVEIVVHVDLNKSKKYKSAAYVQEIVGLISGQGFKVEVKPDSWCASSVADKFTK